MKTGRAVGLLAMVAFTALLRAAPPNATSPTRTRPNAPQPGLKTFGGVSYVAASVICGRLGLQLTGSEPSRRAVLQGRDTRIELVNGSRECSVNGLRVFLGSPVILSAGQLHVSEIDFKLCLTPLVRPDLGTTPPPRPHLIAIDPGHGGSDSGAPNPTVKLLEKDVTLDVAKRLRTLLEKKGYRVFMTRTDDRLLLPHASRVDELVHRAEVAMKAGAELFISIHFNALSAKDQRTTGAEVYTFAPAHQHETDWWDKNVSGDPDLLTTEQPGNRYDHWNVVLAQSMHRQLLRGLKTEDRGKKIMHLQVLRWVRCPAVLVEPAILTHDGEARRLKTPEFREQIAESLAEGVLDFTHVLETVKTPGA